MIEKLKKYHCLKYKLENLNERIIRFKNTLFNPRTSDLSGMPKGGSHATDTMVDSIEYLNMLLYKRKNLKSVMQRLRDEIRNEMRCLDEIERKLLWLRYAEGMIWQDISEKLGYKQRQVFNIHKKALNKLKDVARMSQINPETHKKLS